MRLKIGSGNSSQLYTDVQSVISAYKGVREVFYVEDFGGSQTFRMLVLMEGSQFCIDALFTGMSSQPTSFSTDFPNAIQLISPSITLD
jgi:hypothetical protein